MPDFLKGHWSKAAIGGLVLVNVVLLVLLAVDQRTRPIPAEAVPAGGQSRTGTDLSPTSAGTSASPQPTTSTVAPRVPSSTVSPGSERPPVKRLLTVNSATLGWRAVAGPCPTDPRVEVSRDGGRTWRPTDSGLQSISRMRSYNESAVFAVGGNDNCESQYMASGGPAESWGANPRLLGQTWYRLPTEPNQIHAPGGRLTDPCDDHLRDVAGLGVAGAAALCGKGTLRLSQNGGRQWRDVAGVTTGRAIGADEKVYVLALRKSSCAGVGVVLLGPGIREIKPDSIRCAPVGGGSDEDVAVAVRGRVLWLWVGDDVVTSTDRGRNWERV